MNATPGTPGPTENDGAMGAGIASQSASTGRDGFGVTSSRRNPETLRNELSSMKNELDALMSRASSMSDDELAEAHSRIMSQFSSMRYAARGMASQASRQLKGGVDVTSDYVKEKPMQSVGVAAALGLLLGLLFSHR